MQLGVEHALLRHELLDDGLALKGEEQHQRGDEGTALEGAPAGGQGTMKNVNSVRMRVTQSALVSAGPTFDRLTVYPDRQVSDLYGSPPALRTAELRFAIGPSWSSDGAICLRVELPVPLTVMSMVLDVATGG